MKGYLVLLLGGIASLYLGYLIEKRIEVRKRRSTETKLH